MIANNNTVTTIKTTEVPAIKLLYRRCVILYTKLNCGQCDSLRNRIIQQLDEWAKPLRGRFDDLYATREERFRNPRHAQPAYICDVFEVQDDTTLATYPTLQRYDYDSNNYIKRTDFTDATVLSTFMASSRLFQPHTQRYNVYSILYTTPDCVFCDDMKGAMSELASSDPLMASVHEVVITSLNSRSDMAIVKKESIVRFPTLVRYIRVGETAVQMNRFENLVLMRTVLNPMVSDRKYRDPVLLQTDMRYLPDWDPNQLDAIGPQKTGFVISPSINQYSLFAMVNKVMDDVILAFQYLHIYAITPTKQSRMTHRISSIVRSGGGITIVTEPQLSSRMSDGVVTVELSTSANLVPSDQYHRVMQRAQSMQYSPRYLLSLHDNQELLSTVSRCPVF